MSARKMNNRDLLLSLFWEFVFFFPGRRGSTIKGGAWGELSTKSRGRENTTDTKKRQQRRLPIFLLRTLKATKYLCKTKLVIHCSEYNNVWVIVCLAMSFSGDEIHLSRALKGLSCYELVWFLFKTNNWTISSSWNLHMPISVFLPNYKKKIILDVSDSICLASRRLLFHFWPPNALMRDSANCLIRLHREMRSCRIYPNLLH